jgi:hypothetical protein
MVNASFGEGEERHFLLSCVFGSSSDSLSNLWSAASGIQYDQQRESAFSGISSYIKGLDAARVGDIASLAKSGKLDGNQAQAIIGGLSLRIQAGADGSPDDGFQQALKIVERMKEAGALDTSDTMRFLSNASVGSPLSAWDALVGIKGPLDGDVLQEEGGFIVDRMIRSSPQETLDRLVTLSRQDSSLRKFENEWLGQAAESWLSRDQDEFVAWYSSAGAKLPDGSNDAMVSRVIDVCLRGNDIESAKSWAKSVRSDEFRKQADARIAESAP